MKNIVKSQPRFIGLLLLPELVFARTGPPPPGIPPPPGLLIDSLVSFLLFAGIIYAAFKLSRLEKADRKKQPTIRRKMKTRSA